MSSGGQQGQQQFNQYDQKSSQLPLGPSGNPFGFDNPNIYGSPYQGQNQPATWNGDSYSGPIDQSYQNTARGDQFTGTRDGFLWVAGNRMMPSYGDQARDRLELQTNFGVGGASANTNPLYQGQGGQFQPPASQPATPSTTPTKPTSPPINFPDSPVNPNPDSRWPPSYPNLGGRPGGSNYANMGYMGKDFQSLLGQLMSGYNKPAQMGGGQSGPFMAPESENLSKDPRQFAPMNGGPSEPFRPPESPNMSKDPRQFAPMNGGQPSPFMSQESGDMSKQFVTQGPMSLGGQSSPFRPPEGPDMSKDPRRFAPRSPWQLSPPNMQQLFNDSQSMFGAWRRGRRPPFRGY